MQFKYSVCGYIYHFERKSTVIPEKHIQIIRKLLVQDIEIQEVSVKLNVHTKVEIMAGPLCGISVN